MIETEWLNSTYPVPLLEYLEGRASDRKLRLFACACCRSTNVWRYLSKESRSLVDAAEYLADGTESWERVSSLAAKAPQGRVSVGHTKPVRISLASQAERAVLALARDDSYKVASEVTQLTQNLLGDTVSDLLRDIFGNPFRSTESVVRCSDNGVLEFARAIYVGHRFEDLPVLLGSLRDAGFGNIEILSHLGHEGPHVRGCWALDHIVGRV